MYSYERDIKKNLEIVKTKQLLKTKIVATIGKPRGNIFSPKEEFIEDGLIKEVGP